VGAVRNRGWSGRAEDPVQPAERSCVVKGACARFAMVTCAFGRGESDEFLVAGQRLGELRSGLADVIAFGVADQDRAGDVAGRSFSE
jgi:hypothetical protein